MPPSGERSCPLQISDKTETSGPGQAAIGNPPKDGEQSPGDKDWVALVKRK